MLDLITAPFRMLFSAVVGFVTGVFVWFAAWSVMMVGTLTIGSAFIGWDRATEFAPKIAVLLVPGCYLAAPIGVVWGLWKMFTESREGGRV